MARHAPLSFSQESLWLTEEIVPGVSQYQMIMVFEIEGYVDRAALARSVAEIIRRHELLRSVVDRVAGMPSLIVGRPVGEALGFTDLSGIAPGPPRESAASALISRWYTCPFDLKAAPLLRGELLKLSERRHMLVLATHHIASDAVSIGIVRRELSACYAAFANDRDPALPDLPVQYADYACWQRAAVFGEGLDYWAGRLADLPVLRLPADRPRPPVRAFRRSWFATELDQRVTGSLTALARQRDTTLYCVLLAAFQLLLASWTDAAEAVTGTPVSGRREPGLENLIGFFVNTVVLRTRCEPAEPFTDLLERVKRDLAGDLAHDHVPFLKVVERVRPRRDRGRHPLFQVVFHTIATDEFGELDLDGQVVTDRSVAYQYSAGVITEFDLIVEVAVTAAGLTADFQFAAELFDVDTIADLAGTYHRLLTSIAADPHVAPAVDFRRPPGTEGWLRRPARVFRRTGSSRCSQTNSASVSCG